MSNASPATWYGTARLDAPGDIVAGSIGTWRVIYAVGRYGIDNGGRVRVSMRDASDWSPPQTSEPSADNYLTAWTDGAASLRVSFAERVGFRPFFHTTTVQVFDGSLKEGDQIVVTYGDTSGGARGTRAQTFCESGFEFRVLVECFQTGIFVRVPSSPIVAIGSDAAHRLVAVAPSIAVQGKPFGMLVRAEDRWGNLARDFSGRIEFASMPHLVTPPTHPQVTNGLLRVEDLRLADIGTYRLTVHDPDTGFTARSNPIRVVPTDSHVRIFWADIHGQTESTIGTGTVQEYFTFARDVAGLDIAGHQGNDFQIDAVHWKEIQARVREFHVPGRFVTLLGYEWSGNTPAGGDHNVFYPLADCGTIHRSSHWQVDDKSDNANDRYPITELYGEFAGRQDVLIIPHVGGRACDLTFHAPDLEPVVEIASVHGRFEWLLEEMLLRGYRMGVVGNSDDHTGRPGAASPTVHGFGLRGGLTGVYAKGLTRPEVFAAYKSRHTYATTGERIILEVHVDGRPMGSEFNTSTPPTIRVNVAGTNSLETVELRRGLQTVYVHPLHAVNERNPRLIRITWGGARLRGRGRATKWDGTVVVEKARILDAQAFAFDNPLEGIKDRRDHLVRWTSTTSGDHDGIILRLDSDVAHIAFQSPLLTFSFESQDLLTGTVRHELGGVGLFVTAALLPPASGPENASFTFTDHDVQAGVNAYYVRVVQADGEMAWSSPAYVHYESKRTAL